MELEWVASYDDMRTRRRPPFAHFHCDQLAASIDDDDIRLLRGHRRRRNHSQPGQSPSVHAQMEYAFERPLTAAHRDRAALSPPTSPLS